jgi:hypothetical protein
MLIAHSNGNARKLGVLRASVERASVLIRVGHRKAAHEVAMISLDHESASVL